MFFENSSSHSSPNGGDDDPEFSYIVENITGKASAFYPYRPAVPDTKVRKDKTMRITCTQKELQSALQYLSNICDPSSPHLILQDILIDAREDGRIILSATDTEVSAQHTLTQCEVHEPGQTAVNVRTFSAAIRETPSTRLEITQEPGASQLLIKDETGEINLLTGSPDEFPPLTPFEAERKFVINAGDLERAIEWALLSVQPSAMNEIMTGLLFRIEPTKTNQLLVVGADGNRLSLAKIPIHPQTPLELSANLDVILPQKAARYLDLVTKGDASITLSLGENELQVRTELDFLSTRLIIGRYPEFEDVLGSMAKRYPVTINTQLFSQALRRVSLVLDEEYDAPTLSVSKEQTILHAENPNGGRARIQIPVEYDGPPIDLATPVTFLTDIVNIWKKDNIYIELQDSNLPYLVRDGNNFLYLATPAEFIEEGGP